MVDKYVLDACALLSFLYNEPGCDIVQKKLAQADDAEINLYMHKLNLLEVYYDIRRSKSVEIAEDYYNRVLESSTVVVDSISDAVFREAGRLKTLYRMSLADAVALGLASVLGASILTADHHELDVVEQNEDIMFTWIR